MGDSACKFLSRAKWGRLTTILLGIFGDKNIDGNDVGEKGCKHLSKAAWEELEVIRLGHCSIT